MLLAHRGSHTRLPENTPAAFEEAIVLGADGIECDAQKTAEGTYVVVHDPPAPQAPSGRYPALGEVLRRLHRDRFLDLELKGNTLAPEDCPRILAEIAMAKIDADALLVTSFAADLLPPWKAWGIQTGLLLGDEFAKLGLRRGVALVRRTRPDWLCVPVQIFERMGNRRARLALRIVRLAGLHLAFWTVNTEAELRLIRPLADAIITNEVELMLRLLGRAR